MYRKNSVFLVIPAFNEEKLIKDTILGVPKYVDKIIVIDDGSTDSTAKIVEKLSSKNKKVELIKHKKNMGLGAAIITGYKKTIKYKADIVVVIGGDNQMDLRELEKFLDPIVEGEADYTKGNRFMSKSCKSMPFTRFIGNILLSLMEKPVTGYWNIFDTHDGYTAINKKALKSINWSEAWKGYAYNADFLVRLNLKNMRVKDISRKAIYIKGKKQSKIKVKYYILMAIPLLIRLFFFRIRKKYFK